MHTDSFPVHLDLVGGRLKASVHFHQIESPDGSLACWSYVSEGLLNHGQVELVFTLRCEPHEDPDNIPDDPLNFLIFIEQLASQGQTLDAGCMTRFGPEGAFFSRHLVYIPTQPMAGVPLPPAGKSITALLVTEEELTAVEQFGISRLISRLGYAARYYPCPPWSDRTRTSLSFERARAESVLSRTSRLPARGVSVVMEAERLLVSARADLPARGGVSVAWRRRLSLDWSNTPLALLTDIDPQSDGCLVWEPGQPGPNAITPPGSKGERLSGCFLLFVPGQASDEVRLFEDGYALLISDHSWGTLRFALGENIPPMFLGSTITLPTAGERPEVAIEWTQPNAPG